MLFQISTYIIYFKNRILDKGLSVNNKLLEAIWNYICYDYSYNLVNRLYLMKFILKRVMTLMKTLLKYIFYSQDIYIRIIYDIFKSRRAKEK